MSVSAELIDSAIAVSSSPLASATVSVGASASPVTVTSIVSTVVAVSPPSASVETAVTVRAKSVSLSSAGSMVRPAEGEKRLRSSGVVS